MAKITNYGELKAAIADHLKRRDLTGQIPQFIDTVHIELSEAVDGLEELVDDADTNALLDYNPSLYLFGAIAEGADFIRDEGPLQAYRAKYRALLKKLYSHDAYELLNPSQGPTP